MREINRDGLAQYLRELRQKAGLTQSELSQELLKHGVDVHSGTISGWERAIPIEIKQLVSAFWEMALVDQLLFVAALHAEDHEERMGILDKMSPKALAIVWYALEKLYVIKDVQ
jgi:transcriptional regulator with XRE-family HTH domain